MRSWIRTATLLTAVTAATGLASLAHAEDEAAPEAGTVDAPIPLPSHEINQWVCYADSHGLFEERFEGVSEWFAAGSGKGQAAHKEAYEQALDNCRRRDPRGECTSNFNTDCSVTRRIVPITIEEGDPSTLPEPGQD